MIAKRSKTYQRKKGGKENLFYREVKDNYLWESENWETVQFSTLLPRLQSHKTGRVVGRSRLQWKQESWGSSFGRWFSKHKETTVRVQDRMISCLGWQVGLEEKCSWLFWKELRCITAFTANWSLWNFQVSLLSVRASGTKERLGLKFQIQYKSKFILKIKSGVTCW